MPQTKKIATMSINDVVQALRILGVKTSPMKIADGIETGAYTFGKLIRKNGTRRCFEIFESDFRKWIETKIN